MSVEDTMATTPGSHFRENLQEKWCSRENVGGQNREHDLILVKGETHQVDFKDKMLLMQAQESGAVLDEEQSLFLAGEQVTNVDDDVDDSPENDLALNVIIFEVDD
ncbi:hypothetical protein Tco_0701093 [Tanacetum coccineum]